MANSFSPFGAARDFQQDELSTQENIARMNAGPAWARAFADSAAATMKDNRARDIFSWLKGQFGAGGAAGGAGGLEGGAAAQPQITAGPVWGPQQVQEQVNAARSGIDARTGTQMRQARQSTAGRGFGSNSPLLAALEAGIQGRGMAQGSDAERGIRWDSAQGNAAQMLKGQTAQEAQFAARRQEEIERQRNQLSTMNALIQAMSGLG